MTHMFSSYEDDLFKKFKLKHHRMIPHTYKATEFFKRTIEKKEKYVIQRTVISAVRYDRSSSKHKNKRIANHSVIEWNILLNINSFHCFDKLSTLEILFDNLQLLLNDDIGRTKESIKKICCLLIDTFINWYRTLPFYSIMNLDLNQFILNNQWSNYIILILFYFLKKSFHQTDLISYEKSCERIFNYTQNYYLSSLTNRILNQYLNFLSKFFHIHMTNTEFTLLSILLILQSDQLNSLREIYLKMLYTYETQTFPSEQPFRYNQLLHLSDQIHCIVQLLLKHQHFHLPFLLIPN